MTNRLISDKFLIMEVARAINRKMDPKDRSHPGDLAEAAVKAIDEYRNKESETKDFVCDGVRKYGKVIDTPFPELPEVYSTQNSFIDENTITKTTYKIDPNNLPEGHWWDDEGACYKAEKVDAESFGCEWYWMACNEKALAKGYVGQELHPFRMPIHNYTKT